MTPSSSVKQTYRVTPADRRSFWFIMIPALVEGILLVMFGMIDTLMLGNTADSAVNIASVSLANTPHQFVLCVLNAFAIGTTTAIAFYTGQNDARRISAAARQSFLFMFIAGTTTAVLGILFASPIVTFSGATGELHDTAVLYFRIIMAGFPLEMLTITATACMRGIGLTRVAMTYNIIASAANVLGNYLLIYGKFGFPEMGAAGAALSTTLSKCISFSIALWYMLRIDSPIRLHFRESFRFTRDGLGRVCSVGVTAALEQVILQGGNVIAVKIIATMETASIAAFNICGSINGLSWKPGGACQVATTTFTGRDLGEGRPDKAKARSLMVYRYSLYFSAFMTLFIILFRVPIASFFSPEKEIVTLAGAAMIFDAVSVVGITTHLTLSGALRSAGDTKYPLIASMISIWTARVMIATLLLRMGALNVMTARLCVAIDQLIRGSIVGARFFLSKKWTPKPPEPKGASAHE